MAYNNTVILTGNLGSEATIHEKLGKEFASVSIATQDSYKDENDKWVQKDSIWHDLLVFSPTIVAKLKTLKKGSRISVTGSLSYRFFEAVLTDGTRVKKKEASIIVGKLDLAPLPRKSA